MSDSLIWVRAATGSRSSTDKLRDGERRDCTQAGAHGGVEFYGILGGGDKAIAAVALSQLHQAVDVGGSVAMVVTKAYLFGQARAECL